MSVVFDANLLISAAIAGRKLPPGTPRGVVDEAFSGPTPCASVEQGGKVSSGGSKVSQGARGHRVTRIVARQSELRVAFGAIVGDLEGGAA